MKVHIILVLSVVGLSSARYVKWSPSDVDGQQDFKENFHQFWSQLGDLLAEQDEEDLKEFLHHAIQMHRPIHDENNFNHNMVKPNRPYHHNSRPSYNDQENIMRPLQHEDFDIASQEVIDGEIVRPSSYLRDVAMEMDNLDNSERPIPQRPLRPFHNRPGQFDEEKNVMRPLHDLLAEIDGEMEESLPQNYIMRPLEIEEIDNTMRPLPQKPLRPFHNRPGQVDEEKYVMRPLHDLLAEIDEEMEESLPQNHIMRPLEIEEIDNAVRPLPQKPLRPFHNRPGQVDGEKYVMRPLHSVSAETDSEIQQSLPQILIMRPVRPVDVEEEMDNVMRPLSQKPLRPLPNRPDQIDEEKYVMRPLQDLSAEIDGEMEQSLPQNHIMRPLGPVEIEEMQYATRPHPQKPLRPLPNRPEQIDEEKYVMRPLHDLPAEIDVEMEQSLPIVHLL